MFQIGDMGIDRKKDQELSPQAESLEEDFASTYVRATETTQSNMSCIILDCVVQLILTLL